MLEEALAILGVLSVLSTDDSFRVLGVEPRTGDGMRELKRTEEAPWPPWYAS